MQANSISSSVYKGAYISAGSKIGQVGKTGNATGNHLHFYCGTSAWKGDIQISKSASDYGNSSTSNNPSVNFWGTEVRDLGNSGATLFTDSTVRGGEIKEWGFKIRKAGDSYWNTYYNPSTRGWESQYNSFWFQQWISNLQSGTSYEYKCYIKVENTSFESSIITFKTTGNTPHTHSYTSTVVAPTCTSQGYTLHKCSCGTSYKDKYVSATGHKYSNGICKVCGAKDPNYIETTKRSPYLTISSQKITLDLSGENSKTIYITAQGDLPDKFTVEFICKSQVECEWGEWSEKKVPLSITGKSIGNNQVIINLYESESYYSGEKKVLYSAVINVTVFNNSVNSKTNSSLIQIMKKSNKTVTKPAKVKSVKLTAKKKKLNVKWKKISGATGYEVMYAKNNKFKGKKTVKVKKNKVTIKRLKSKKKYFVKVRAYKKANGNTSYGKWSKVVKKKVK